VHNFSQYCAQIVKLCFGGTVYSAEYNLLTAVTGRYLISKVSNQEVKTKLQKLFKGFLDNLLNMTFSTELIIKGICNSKLFCFDKKCAYWPRINLVNVSTFTVHPTSMANQNS